MNDWPKDRVFDFELNGGGEKMRVIFILLISVFFVSTAQASTVLLQPENLTVRRGETFLLNLVGRGFVSNLDGGGVSLEYDPAILHVTDVVVNGDIWNFFTSNGVINNANGLVEDLRFNAFRDVTGDFQIATLDYIAKSVGTTNLGLSETLINPFASGGSVLAVDLVDASVSVVPIPSAVWLLGAGMIGLIGFRRKCRC
jgi:hypothetical protein